MVLQVISMPENDRSEKLKNNDPLFRAIFEQSGEGIALSDTNGNLILVNDAFRTIFGYSEKELMAMNARDLLPDGTGATPFAHALKEQSGTREFELVRKDRSSFWAEIKECPVTFNSQSYILGMVRDITKQKKAETVVESFFDQPMNLHLISGFDGLIHRVNAGWKTFLGYDKHEVEGTFFYGLLHPEDLKASDREMERLREGQTTFYFENRYLHKNGDYRVLAWSAIASLEDRMIYAVGSDITDRIKTEKALRESEDKFRHIFDHSPIGKSITHFSGEMDVNKAFHDMLGYSRDEFKQLKWQDITHPEDIEYSQRVVDSFLSGKATYARLTKRYIHKNGSEVWVDVSTAIRRDSDGKPLYLMSAMNDITELKKSEEKYRSLFMNMLNGYAYCKMIFDGDTPVDFIYLDVNSAFEKLTGLKDVVGKKVTDVIPGISETDREFIDLYGKVALSGIPETFEIYLESLSMWFSVSAYCPEKGFFVAIFDVITERKQVEIEQDNTIRMLEILNAKSDLRALMKTLLTFMKDLSGCEAVGIRLRDGDDFPYYETSGFSDDFVEAETHLCVKDLNGQVTRDCEGNPVLECMCGNILCGRFDPSMPFFTEFGSFISNGTTRLLASTTEEDRKARTRNRCNGQGYESVFLVPLRSGGEAFGLLQFNDKREGCFSPRFITQAENLAGNVAMALAQRKAEASLHESVEKYRVLFNTFPLGITISDESGNIVEANNKSTDLLGIAREEQQTRTIDGLEWRLIHPDGSGMRTDEWPSVRALKENRLIENVEMGVVKPDGDTAWLSVTAAPLPLQKYGVVVTYGDISDRKRAERDYQTLFRAMLEGFALHEIIIDDAGRPADYRFLAVNPAFEKMTGLAAQKVIGRTVLDILPETEPYWIETYGKVALTGEPAFFDNYTAALDKHFQITVFRPAPGQFACILADITQQKKDQERLRESEERFRTIFEQAAVGVARGSIEGHFLEVNDKFCQIVGYSREELYYVTFREITHPEDRSLDERKLQRVLKGGMDNYEIEKRFIRKDGGSVWVNLYTNAVRNHDGRIKYAIAIATDISERKKIEAEREKLQNQLNQAQRLESIGNLAGGIAHDFNNILFPIIGISEMLMEDLDPSSPEHENAEEIFKAGRRGSDLVKQILAFSRQAEQKKSPTRVQHILKEVLKLSRSTLPANIEINQDIQPDCGMILADSTQIHQVAMNIITNAYHAVESGGGSISVRLREMALEDTDLPDPNLEPGKYAVLSIFDTGIGIAPDVIESIFDPYFTTKALGKGTGLGLAVVHGIVKDHHGAIKVYSEVDRGTAFHVYLPLMGKTVEALPTDTKKPSPKGDERILLVDDEAPIAKLEEHILTRLGYKITSRLHSVEALELFKANPDAFDLVISDMTMPLLTGAQLAKALLSIRPDIPIIICTGFSEKIDEEKALSIGVKGFLMKPIVRNQLAQMVRNVLDKAKGNT